MVFGSAHGRRDDALDQSAPDDVGDGPATFIPASLALQQLRAQAPTDSITLDWLLSSLQRRSFGMVILLLALVALIPGICNIVGILLMIAAVQMLLGQASPRFPARIARRSLPARHFLTLVDRAVPVLRRIETMVHPRWPIASALLDRFSGVGILLLALAISTTPIPLSNIAPAIGIALIALAMLEQDGLLMVVALGFAGLMVSAAVIAVEQAWRGAEWIGHIL